MWVTQRYFNVYKHIIALAYTCLILHAAARGGGGGVAAGGPQQQQQQSPYKSVRDLDQYGKSAQLRNAMLASSRQSAPVVAAIATASNSIIICSIKRTRPGIKTRNHQSGHAVHIVASDDYDNDDLLATGETESQQQKRTTTAIVFSGNKADAILLLKIMREYGRRTWERYDSIPSVERVADGLSEALLSFMRYDRESELHDGTGKVIVDGDFDMARPFGVQSLVLGVRGGPATIRSVDPSGVQNGWVARALGRGSDRANQMLEGAWKPGLEEGQVRDMCVKILRDLYREEQEQHVRDDGMAGGGEDVVIICEIVSSRGLSQESLSLLEKDVEG